MAENVCNGRRGPFVELGALHKLLDILKPDDLECSSAWYSSSEPCCKEIVLRFRNLLDEWASDDTRVQDCLAKECSLTKCEHCGVIKCVELPQVQENAMKKKRDDGITIAEREDNCKLNIPAAKPAVSSTRKQEIMRNSHPTVPRHYRSDLPIPSDKLTMGNNRRNAISKKPQASKSSNNKRLHEKNTIGSAPATHDKCFDKEDSKSSDTGAEKYSAITEPVRYLVRENCSAKEDYESQHLPDKSALTRNTIGTAPAIDDKCFDKEDSKSNNTGAEKYSPIMETVRYLVRENCSAKEEYESQLLPDKSALTRQSYFQRLPMGRKNSFALHGSRDTSVHDCPGFLLCDRMRVDEGDLNKGFPMVREDTTTKFDGIDISGSVASYLQPNNDSVNLNFHESDTSAFDCSSANNLTRQWINPGWDVGLVNLDRKGRPENIKNVQNVEAQTTDDYLVDDNGKLTDPADNLTIIQPARHCNEDDLPVIDDVMETLDDHELPGISRVMKNSLWDERISDTTVCLTATSKTKKENVIPDIKSCKSSNHEDVISETSECLVREILHDQISSDDAICENAITMAASKVLLNYRKILESNEEMDWESFQHLVSALHPRQRELWRDICKAISTEAKRLAEETGATTEVCIELNPLPIKEKRENVCCRGNEISFELDMTLKDIQQIVLKNDYSAVSKKSKKIHKLGIK